ncbi:hypothetical protein J4Q44_G00345550 [Coregonus suidteri]|uniref:Uncharacterized protein n=1 Tax=Coregonus suidteri TaxID=861788 RepID=A0AAN8KIE4_9TELE
MQCQINHASCDFVITQRYPAKRKGLQSVQCTTNCVTQPTSQNNNWRSSATCSIQYPTKGICIHKCCAVSGDNCNDVFLPDKDSVADLKLLCKRISTVENFRKQLRPAADATKRPKSLSVRPKSVNA